MIAVVFHVPVVTNDGESIHPFTISKLINFVIDEFGGVTIIQAEGAWRHDGDLYREPVLRVLVGVPESEVESFVEAIDHILKTDFSQQAVWIEVDGKPSIR